MRVAQGLKFLAFLSKVLKEFPAFFLAASLMKQLVGSIHSDRASFQLSIVHGAQAPLFSSDPTLRFACLLGSVGGAAICDILLES